MMIVLRCILYALVLGVCLGTSAIKAQIVNPTYAILTLEHYRAYFSFYMLGTHLASFARLGVLAGALVGLQFLLSTSSSLGLDRFVRYSANGEQFSWPWRALACCSSFVLGLMFQLGLLLVIACDLMTQALQWYHFALLSGLVLIPILMAAKLDSDVPEHRVLRMSIVGLVLSGILLGTQTADVLVQLPRKSYLVVPLLSTHYGPWGILGWVIGLAACIGVAVGVALLGLTPLKNAEPDTLEPVERKNFATAAALGLGLTIFLLALYPLYFVPRYQIGLDLSKVLNLQRGRVQGRTVVFLDHYDKPHTVPALETLSIPKNLEHLSQWLTTAPAPSALTRPAGKILADQALWQWRPHDALDWLEVHRRRLRFSNLNRAFLVALLRAKPSPKLVHHLDALTNKNRFAWPGPGSRLEISHLLRRYGRIAEAKKWARTAEQLGGEHLPQFSEPQSPSVLQGRLLLDGSPLAGVPVAIFRGDEPEELLQRTRKHIESDARLLEQNWYPTYYQYLDFEKLLNFYAVDKTDALGRFLFEDVEPGLYRVAVRLEHKARLTTSGELVKITPGVNIVLDTLQLETSPLP